jgi:hypothetical protein
MDGHADAEFLRGGNDGMQETREIFAEFGAPMPS